MSLGYGIGKGLESFGDSLMRIFMLRDENKQKAMDRALTEKRLDTQQAQQQSTADYHDELARNQRDLRDRDHARDVATYYGGAEDVPQEAVDSLAPRYRSIMVQSKPTGGTIPAPMPEGMPIPAGSFEAPEIKHSIRQPVTAGERTATINAAAREKTEQLRQSYLMKKLASDEKFKQMAHELGQERLMAFINNASQQIGMQAANMDQRAQLAFFEAQMDAEIARFQAENRNQNDPMQQVMADLLRSSMPAGGVAPSTPTTPTAPRPIQIPTPPPTRGGVRPPASAPPGGGDEKSKLDAILNRNRPPR
jgi:hypothetical protein